MFSCCQDCRFVCILLYTLTSLVLKLQKNCAVDLLCADVEIVSDIFESSHQFQQSSSSASLPHCALLGVRCTFCSTIDHRAFLVAAVGNTLLRNFTLLAPSLTVFRRIALPSFPC